MIINNIKTNITNIIINIMSTQISKEDLLAFTHQLHNELRGAKCIKLTGLPALNEI